MKFYETTLIIDSSLDQVKIDQTIEAYEEMIKSSGEIISLQKWGKRRLAYPIDKKPIGYYVHYLYKSTHDIPLKLEKDFILNNKLMRFLTIALDKRALKQMEKDKDREMMSPSATTEAEAK